MKSIKPLFRMCERFPYLEDILMLEDNFCSKMVSHCNINNLLEIIIIFVLGWGPYWGCSGKTTVTQHIKTDSPTNNISHTHTQYLINTKNSHFQTKMHSFHSKIHNKTLILTFCFFHLTLQTTSTNFQILSLMNLSLYQPIVNFQVASITPMIPPSQLK